MALLTPLSLAQAQQIGKQLGLELIGLEPIARGVNSNFKLSLAGGAAAFMRVCEEASVRDAQEQSRLLHHLARRGLPIVAPLSRLDGDEAPIEHEGKPVVVFPFCEGRVCRQAAVREHHLTQLGRVLGSMHLAGQDFVMAAPDRFTPVLLRQRLEALRRAAPSTEICETVERLEPLLHESESSWVQRTDTVVHGDLFRDNVLWRADASLGAVIDFDCAAPGAPVYDVMVCMLAWCFGDHLERPLAGALLRGYQAVRPLDAEELHDCFDQARLACLRFLLTRIESYELSRAEEIVFKDFRRFGARLRALEAIGASQFVDWLNLS